MFGGDRMVSWWEVGWVLTWWVFGEMVSLWVVAPQTKNICFVGCVSKIMPNNFFVDGCGCQEVELRTSLTNGLSKI